MSTHCSYSLRSKVSRIMIGILFNFAGPFEISSRAFAGSGECIPELVQISPGAPTIQSFPIFIIPIYKFNSALLSLQNLRKWLRYKKSHSNIIARAWESEKRNRGYHGDSLATYQIGPSQLMRSRFRDFKLPPQK